MAENCGPSRHSVCHDHEGESQAEADAEKRLEVRAVNRDKVAIVLVEQNASEALAVADRAYILVDGRTSRTGEARTLAADPEIRRIFLGG